jgi:uncharacterized protein YjbI with pentapeptide repeats/cell division protein FtsL
MRKISPMVSTSVSSKIVKPTLIASGVAVVFVVSLLVFFQQNNINSLDIEIKELGKKIWQASSIDEWLKLKKDILGFEKDKTIIQNGAYTNLVQAIGGFILGITAWIGYQNFRVGEKNLKISEDKQVSERFSKSIEHLGSHETAIRLGGIYALEQIAIDSAKYHWTIVEILSAFVREKCPLDNVAPPAGNSEKTSLEEQSEQKSSVPTYKKVDVDIQAAMTVLCRRKVEQDPPDKRIDLRNVSLPLIEIQKASLSGVNLSGAILSEASLNGASLNGAILSRANLSRTALSEVNLNEANLYEAKLNRAYMLRAKLYGANLSGANLHGAVLWGADLSRANLSGANLSGADLSNTRFGDNLGISDDMKKEFKEKGAIFEDSPGS